MVSAMVECAYALGMAAGAMAKACKDPKGFFAASDEFRRCFFAVRMGIRLKMSLAAGVRPAPVRAAAEAPERDPDEPDPDERDRSERDPMEREREGDREPVSLPQFLKALGVVARNAERRKAELPPEIATETLPRLHSLLAQANGRTAEAPTPKAAAITAGATLLERPQAAPPIRARLLGSTAAPPRGPPRRSSA